MPALDLNVPIETTEPDLSLDSRDVGVGEHLFRLEVVDDSGRRSAPTEVRIVIRPPKLEPVAVLDVPLRVPRGQPIRLIGERSVAAPLRRVVLYQWQASIPSPLGVPTTVNRETTQPFLELPGSSVAGKFRLSLTVRDDRGIASEPHSATLVII